MNDSSSDASSVVMVDAVWSDEWQWSLMPSGCAVELVVASKSKKERSIIGEHMVRIAVESRD